MKILKLFALRYILVKHDYELFVRIPVYNNIFIYLITIAVSYTHLTLPTTHDV